MEPMNLLVTLDQNYLPPLRVMLKSLFNNNRGGIFKIFMLHTEISDEACLDLEGFCHAHGSSLAAIRIPEETFGDAPTFRHYTKAMYYRLLAFQLLPAEINKILYLDPDILVLNPVRHLYDLDVSNYLYAAAMHSAFGDLPKYLNQVRLRNMESEGYFNSGVLLMNLASQRREIKDNDIFTYVREHGNLLVLPDQDVINALYGEKILPIDDTLYNYDARLYTFYNLINGGEKDLDWVIGNTVFLHFCGKNKPWHKSSMNKFTALYKHYMVLAERSSTI